MSFGDGFVAFWLFLVGLAVWMGSRAIVRALTWQAGALELVHEALAKVPPVLSKMSDGGAPNALSTRMEGLETGFQGVKLTVADAVERITALSNRVSARQRRRDELEDENEDEGGGPPSPEALKALAALTGGDRPASQEPEPSRGGGLGLKERAHRQLQRGGR